MRERPTDVDDADVLETVRAAWDPEIDEVEHLPVGFGAHHWAASAGGERRLFVTLDRLAPRHSPASLEGAYAGAAALFGNGLEFGLLQLSLGRSLLRLSLAVESLLVVVKKQRHLKHHTQ